MRIKMKNIVREEKVQGAEFRVVRELPWMPVKADYEYEVVRCTRAVRVTVLEVVVRDHFLSSRLRMLMAKRVVG